MLSIIKYVSFAFCILFSFNIKAEETVIKKEPVILLLQCTNGLDLISDRLRNIKSELVDKNHWKVNNHEYYYFIPFGLNWEDVEEACYAYEAYLEIATYTRSEAYSDKKECKEGIFGRGTKYLRDSWGGYFEGNYTNTFISKTNTCNIRANYKLLSNEATRINESKKRTCELAKQYFYNLIIDPAFGKEGWQKTWQKRNCKEISVENFETKVGISVNELKEVLAKDVI